YSEQGGASWITFSSLGGTAVLDQLTVAGNTNGGGEVPVYNSMTFQSLDRNVDTEVQLSHSLFENNYGSGLYLTDISNSQIDDLVMRDNVGKAIVLGDVGSAVLTNLDISGQELGAIWAYNMWRTEGTYLEIGNSRIHDNVLTFDEMYGNENVTAGLTLNSYTEPMQVVIADSEVVDNDSTQNTGYGRNKAGAIVLIEADLTVRNSSVLRNVTSGSDYLAGGITYSEGAHVTVENSNFGTDENENIPYDTAYFNAPGHWYYNFGDGVNFECDGATHICTEW
ncbi:MAG TPA: right-handed parallel beta-helix repeat-containing protein, partial [bacterium]|nr:right-handed parallel beta-helix repeat-containing protein [bacterium]